MDFTGFLRASIAVGKLPHGPTRLSRREDLVIAAEESGDPKALAYALLMLAWDEYIAKDFPAAVVAFARAWRIRQTHPEVFDERLSRKVRLVFPFVVTGMQKQAGMPRRELDRLMDEMEGFFRSGGSSLRAVYRCRYLIHRARGETDLAGASIESMLTEPRDGPNACEWLYLSTAASWYTSQAEWARAADLWRSITSGAASCRCTPKHLGTAHSELMVCLCRQGRYAEARLHRDIGYPLVRGLVAQQSQVLNHMWFFVQAREFERALEIVQEHASWIADDSEGVAEFWRASLKVLQVCTFAQAAGYGRARFVRADGRITTVAELRAELDILLGDYAAGQDAQTGERKFQALYDHHRRAR
jgi:hypothetical protein